MKTGKVKIFSESTIEEVENSINTFCEENEIRDIFCSPLKCIDSKTIILMQYFEKKEGKKEKKKD